MQEQAYWGEVGRAMVGSPAPALPLIPHEPPGSAWTMQGFVYNHQVSLETTKVLTSTGSTPCRPVVLKRRFSDLQDQPGNSLER